MALEVIKNFAKDRNEYLRYERELKQRRINEWHDANIKRRLEEALEQSARDRRAKEEATRAKEAALEQSAKERLAKEQERLAREAAEARLAELSAELARLRKVQAPGMHELGEGSEPT